MSHGKLACLNVYYQNVGGLRSKLAELRYAFATCLHDIIIFTESNLTPDINSAELGASNFNVFRKDRSGETSDKQSGGGVLIAAKKCYPAHCLQTDSFGTESIFVSLTVGREKLLLGGVYLPPGQPSHLYLRFCSALDVAVASTDYSKLIVSGDFNLPNHPWSEDIDSNSSPSARYIQEAANSFSLKQINTQPNQRGVLLDLVFSSNIEATTTRSLDPMLLEVPHHPALDISLPIEAIDNSRSYNYVPNYKKCDLEKVFSELHFLPLYDVCSNLDIDVNSCFRTLVDMLGGCVSKFTPLKRVGGFHFPSWFSKELKDSIFEKKILHTRYKETLDINTYNLFSRVRARCKYLSRECLNDYIGFVQEALPRNPKVFWSYVKNLKNSSDCPSVMKLGSKTAKNPNDMCNLFADFFSSVFHESTSTSLTSMAAPLEYVSSCTFSLQDVTNVLESLDVSKGCGPDCIPPSVLKRCSSVLAAPLQEIFNRCIACGTFPDILKVSYVVPIHKSGSTSDVGNYRPIAVQPVLAKIFERLVLSKIYPFLRRIITPNQHGFMPNKSTVTNLVVFQNDIISSYKNRAQTDAIYLDFSKAFDKVSHPHLLNKLQSHGVYGPLLEWFSSYLLNRRLRVRFAGAFSRDFVATSGVPQGSHLGPTLFDIFVNDISEVIEVKHLLFADDIKLYASVSSVNDCLFLQESLRAIETWCEDNLMILNADKCVSISFTRSHQPVMFDYTLHQRKLERRMMVRDLGVVLSPTLSPTLQVKRACNSASRSLGMIFRFSRNLHCPFALRSLYCAYVRPHLEYCSTVWSPHQDYLIQDMDRIQRRFLHLVGLKLGFGYRDAPIKDIAALLGFKTLEVRRMVQDVLFLYRILNGLLDCPEILASINLRVPSSTRSQDLFARLHHATNYEMNSTINRMQRLGNILTRDVDFFHDGIAYFKRTSLAILEQHSLT